MDNENEIVKKDYVAMIVEGDMVIGRRRAADLVNSALISHGFSPWEDLCIDLFAGKGCSLIIARPEAISDVYIADYALPFLQDYLT